MTSFQDVTYLTQATAAEPVSARLQTASTRLARIQHTLNSVDTACARIREDIARLKEMSASGQAGSKDMSSIENPEGLCKPHTGHK